MQISKAGEPTPVSLDDDAGRRQGGAVYPGYDDRNDDGPGRRGWLLSRAAGR
jgi:hypothetical protein